MRYVARDADHEHCRVFGTVSPAGASPVAPWLQDHNGSLPRYGCRNGTGAGTFRVVADEWGICLLYWRSVADAASGTQGPHQTAKSLPNPGGIGIVTARCCE